MTSHATRHPELVSGSSPRCAQVQRRQAKPHGQVMPIGIAALDKVDFPLPMPVLELLLAGDGGGHVGEHFVPHEAVDPVPRGEAFDGAFAVLPKPFNKIAGHANVERPIRLARKDIDARDSFQCNASERDAPWTLKQVQGDGVGLKHCHSECVAPCISRHSGKEVS